MRNVVRVPGFLSNPAFVFLFFFVLSYGNSLTPAMLRRDTVV